MKLIGFDIETAGEGEAFGLQPYRVLQGSARITSCAFVSEDGDTIFAKLNPTVEELREQFLQCATFDDHFVLIGWNTLFDVSWLIACGLEKEVRQCNWLDGEVLRRAIENDTSDKKYGLKPTVAKYLPEFAGYENAVAGDLDKVDQTLLDYNILDSGLTAKLGRIFWDQLDFNRRVLSLIISQCIVPVAGSWVEGLTIDVDAVDTWERKIDEEVDESWLRFVKECDISDYLSGDFECDRKILASHTKLKQLLHIKGHPVECTDKAELSKFRDVPLIKAISDYKTANTSKTKFIAGIRKSLQYNQSDRTHPSCRLWNTYTGRFGYSSKTLKKFQTGIPIHQFPRKTEARSCIIAPEGYLLAEYDFATQESRLICDFSGDETLFDIFSRGLDFHSYMAAIIMQEDYNDFLAKYKDGDPDSKQHRYLGKIANLSCQYRTGWKTLQVVARRDYEIDIDDRTAKKLVDTYRSTYKRVPEYWDTSIQCTKEQGYAETRGGRRVYIDDWSRANAWSAESTAINFPIQGTGADMKCLAIAQIDKTLHENGGKYLLDLHDALFCLVPDTENGYNLALRIRSTLSNLPYTEYYNWNPRVALPVDLKIGKAWGTLEEVK